MEQQHRGGSDLSGRVALYLRVSFSSPGPRGSQRVRVRGLGSDVRLEGGPRRGHQRRGPHGVGREVGRRGARVARRPAVLVEVLGAAHGVAALDAALGHAVLALELGGAPGAGLAPPHHVPLALLQLAEALALAERLGALQPLVALGAAVERLGAQHALALAAQRLGALELGRVGLLAGRARRLAALQRRAVALGALRVGQPQPVVAGVRRPDGRLRGAVVVGHRVAARRLRPRVHVLLVVVGGRGVTSLFWNDAVLLLGVVGVVARGPAAGRRGRGRGGRGGPGRGGSLRLRPGARRVGLVGRRRGRVAQVLGQPGGLELLGAQRGRHALRVLAAVGGRAGAGLALVQLVLALVRVRDAAVVERRRVVQRAQLLVEGAGQGGHQIAGSCNNAADVRAGRGLVGLTRSTEAC